MKTVNVWTELDGLIAEFAQAAVDHSWRGGGDPLDARVIEARLEVRREELISHISKMRRELGEGEQ